MADTTQPQLPSDLQGLTPAEVAAKIFASMDANGDGYISLSESKLPADVFTTLSVDGQIGKDTFVSDFLSHQPSQGQAPTPPSGGQSLDPAQLAAKIFADMDTNGDGYLTSSEWKLPADLFTSLSVDGKVSQDALVADITAHQGTAPTGTPPSGTLPMGTPPSGTPPSGANAADWLTGSLNPGLAGGLGASTGQAQSLDLSLTKQQGFLAQG